MEYLYIDHETINNNYTHISSANSSDSFEKTKQICCDYRSFLHTIKCIYELANLVLEKAFPGQSFTLPVDVEKVAEIWGFLVFDDDFKELRNGNWDRGFGPPMAQLKMRKNTLGSQSGNVSGTIRVANYLSENSVRFSIAHELGHFALREQNPIGSSYLKDACPGLYPSSKINSSEMLADAFAYALLLPPKLFEEERTNYENDRTHRPLDFSDFVQYIRDRAQLPEYHVVLACNQLKQYEMFVRYYEAEEMFLNKFADLPKEKKRASVLFYGTIIEELEKLSYSLEQIRNALELPSMDALANIHDFMIRYKGEKGLLKEGVPEEIRQEMAGMLKRLNLSPGRIEFMTRPLPETDCSGAVF